MRLFQPVNTVFIDTGFQLFSTNKPNFKSKLINFFNQPGRTYIYGLCFLEKDNIFMERFVRFQIRRLLIYNEPPDSNFYEKN